MRATSWLLLYTFTAIPASFVIGVGEFTAFLLLTGLVSGFLAMIVPDTVGSAVHIRDDESQGYEEQETGWTENQKKPTEVSPLGASLFYAILKMASFICNIGGLSVPGIAGFYGYEWWFIFVGSFLFAIGHIFERTFFYINESRQGQWLVWIKLPLINTCGMTIVSGPIYGLAYLAKTFL
jgi:hypothetical protein